jgi:putative Holliday junction resolvase
MALDVGEKRIGVALSDATGLIATPLTTIDRRNEAADLDAVLSLAAENGVEEIIVGLPLTLAGRVGPQARRTAHFADELTARATMRVKTIDERYSTVEAERLMREAGGKPSRERARVDAAAAAVILQGYLDAARTAQG